MEKILKKVYFAFLKKIPLISGMTLVHIEKAEYSKMLW